VRTLAEQAISKLANSFIVVKEPFSFPLHQSTWGTRKRGQKMTTVKETLLSTLDWKHTFEGKPRSRRFWQCKLTEGTMIILNYFKKTQKTKTKWEQTNASLLHRCFNNHGSRERVETKGNQWHEQLSWPLLPPTLFSGTFLGPFCRKIHVFFLSFQSFLKKVWQIQQFFSWQKWKKTYPRSSKQQKQIKHLSDYCRTFN